MNNAQALFDHLVTRMMHLLRQREEDNFDHDRFGQTPGKEHAFEVDRHRNYLYFLSQNSAQAWAVYNLFQDEASRRLFLDLIEYRLVGHQHKRLPTNTPAYNEAKAKALSLASKPSTFSARLQNSSLGLPFETVSVPFQNRTLQLDCWKLGCRDAFFLNQYCFDRGGVKIAPQPGDHFIDGGTCFGDTAVRMAAQVGDAGFIYCFDPIDLHCDIASHNLSVNAAGSAPSKIFRCGVADIDRSGAVSTQTGIKPGYRLQSGIATRSIDSLVEQGEIKRVDFIKLDVEGSEMLALHGAAKSLARFRPKLAISLYHNPQDLFEIPLHIKKALPDYELYIDHYTIHAEETVLYARPPDKH